MLSFVLLQVRMKKMITFALLAALGGFVQAEEAVKTDAKSKSAKSAKAPCDGGQPAMIKLAVTGLDKEGAAAAAQKKLNMTAGVTHYGACAKSGTVVVKFVPEILGVADIEKAIAGNGLKVAGHKTSMTVTGLKCQLCSDELEEILVATGGIVQVDTVCKKSGTVAVTYDASKINTKKIKATVNATKYKVVVGAAKEDCKKACDKVAVPQS